MRVKTAHGLCAGLAALQFRHSRSHTLQERPIKRRV